MTEAAETAPITIITSALLPIRDAGRVRFVASATIDTGNMDIAISNIQVVADGGRLFVRLPQTRDPATGRWLPAVRLPEQIETALAVMLLEQVPGAVVRTVTSADGA